MITTFGIIGFLLLEHGVTSLVEARLHAKLRALAARGVPSSSSPSKFSRGNLFPRKKPACCDQAADSAAAASASKLGGGDVENAKGGSGCHSHAHSHPHSNEEALDAAAAARPPHTDACCPPSPDPRLCGGSGDLSIANVHGPALAHSHGHKHGGSKEAEAGGSSAAAAAATTATSAAALTLPSAGGEDCDVALRHAAVAQVLEFGIAMHSFIIGIALGVSREPAEIKPLLIAITFHQVTFGFFSFLFPVAKIGGIFFQKKRQKTHFKKN